MAWLHHRWKDDDGMNKIHDATNDGTPFKEIAERVQWHDAKTDPPTVGMCGDDGDNKHYLIRHRSLNKLTRTELRHQHPQLPPGPWKIWVAEYYGSKGAAYWLCPDVDGWTPDEVSHWAEMPLGPLAEIALATQTDDLIEYWCSYCHCLYHDHPDDVESGELPGKPCDATIYSACPNYLQEQEMKAAAPDAGRALPQHGSGP